MRVCFVCLGNICRSPTAEAVMASELARRGLSDDVSVDSAGTGGWHVGDPPDARAVAAAARRDVAMAHLRARQFGAADFDRADLVVAMDRANLEDLERLAPDPGTQDRIHLLRSFDPAAGGVDPLGLDHAVPDPYYSGEDGFDLALDLIEAACVGLADHIERVLGADGGAGGSAGGSADGGAGGSTGSTP